MKNLDTLLESLSRGDNTALDSIYALTSKALFSLAMSILKSPQQSEDAVQETYLTLLKTRNYKRGGNAFSYIYTICKNHALKILNSNKRTAPLDERTAAKNIDADNQIFLDSLMQTLDERSREIVFLYSFAALKHKEIAKLMNLPEGTVRFLYADALKKLKEQK